MERSKQPYNEFELWEMLQAELGAEAVDDVVQITPVETEPAELQEAA